MCVPGSSLQPFFITEDQPGYQMMKAAHLGSRELKHSSVLTLALSQHSAEGRFQSGPLGPTARVPDSEGPGWGPQCTSLTSSHVAAAAAADLETTL